MSIQTPRRDTAAPVLDLYQGVKIPDSAIGAIPTPGNERGWRERGKLESNTPPCPPGYVQEWAPVQWRDGEPIPSTAMDMLRDGWLPQPVTGGGAYQTQSAVDHRGASTSVYYMDGNILFYRKKEHEDRARELMRARNAQKTGDSLRSDKPRWGDRYGDTFEGLKSQATVGRSAAELVDS